MFANIKYSSNCELWLVIVVFIAYSFGTLTLQHYLPSQIDFIPNITVIGLLNIGLFWLLTVVKTKKMGLDTVFWLSLFILVIIQPFFITVTYLDGLIFPIATLLSCVILSTLVNNIRDKTKAIQYSAYGLILVGIANMLTQLVQYFNIVAALTLVMPLQEGYIRFYGNVAQPNQLAFIYALAITACHFVYIQKSDNKKSFKWQVILLGLLLLFNIGIALSSSRGGLILVLSTLLLYFIVFKDLTSFFKVFSQATLAMFIGYILGSYLLDIYSMPTQANAISRMTEGSLYLRIELLQQAWVQFQHHPIIGVGLGNLLADSINHVEEFNGFVFSIHSHNIVAQIAAEMGLIGLVLLSLPFYIIIKDYWRSRSVENSFLLIVLLIVGLYSFSEYPLWFTRFLILAVFLLGLINTKTIKINLNVKGLFSIICTIIVMGSAYYYYQYQSYSQANSFLTNYTFKNPESMSATDYQEFIDFQVEIVTDLKPIFGFTDYKELYIFYLLPKNNEQLSERIALGSRVLTKFLTPSVLMKQALYLGLNNQQIESLQIFKSACLLNHSESCDEVTSYLNEVADRYQQFENIRKDYNIWINKNQAKIKVATFR